MKKKKKDNKTQEYLEGWKRALADYENLKRDMETRLEESRKRIKTSVAEELLPVLDNFHQAVEHAPPINDAKIENWLQGVTFIEKQLEEVMVSIGLEQIKTIGEQFDPNLHEAVEQVEDQSKKDQEIIKENQKGWKIGETVIRPAKVIINNL